MSAIATDCGMDASGVADVGLAVTEAASNAVMHAYAQRQGELSVTADVEDGELSITIGDDGSGFSDRPDNPGLGAGLSIIATVTERLRIVSNAGGTEIHMAFRCSDGA
jgi:two-component sensor histidine kinase